MTGAATLSPLFLKEVRALAPVFAGTAAFVIACSVSTISPLAFLGPIAYVAGTIALGSLAIGRDDKVPPAAQRDDFVCAGGAPAYLVQGPGVRPVRLKAERTP